MKSAIFCPICNSEKNSPYFPLCLECLPYFYTKSSFPHQKARRRKEWIENRLKFIKKADYTCKWCGARKEENPSLLSIHHPWEINARTYEHLWNEIVSKKQKELEKKDPCLKEMLSLRANYEEKKKLRLKLKKKTDQKSITTIKTKLKSNKFRKTQYARNKVLSIIYPFIYNEALRTYQKEVKLLVSEYVKMDDAIVLCKKCHSAARLGKKMCKKCRTNYHDAKYELCYCCNVKERGKRRKKEKIDGDWDDKWVDWNDEGDEQWDDDWVDWELDADSEMMD
jgi:hypothetical protein